MVKAVATVTTNPGYSCFHPSTLQKFAITKLDITNALGYPEFQSPRVQVRLNCSRLSPSKTDHSGLVFPLRLPASRISRIAPSWYWPLPYHRTGRCPGPEWLQVAGTCRFTCMHASTTHTGTDICCFCLFCHWALDVGRIIEDYSLAIQDYQGRGGELSVAIGYRLGWCWEQKETANGARTSKALPNHYNTIYYNNVTYNNILHYFIPSYPIL